MNFGAKPKHKLRVNRVLSSAVSIRLNFLLVLPLNALDDDFYQTRVLSTSHLFNFNLTDFFFFFFLSILTYHNCYTFLNVFCLLNPNLYKKKFVLLKAFQNFMITLSFLVDVVVLSFSSLKMRVCDGFLMDESINLINFINRRFCVCDGGEKNIKRQRNVFVDPSFEVFVVLLVFLLYFLYFFGCNVQISKYFP